MRTCGRVPWQSPPSHTVRTGQEISVRRLTVKQIWIVFHDELYLVSPSHRLGQGVRTIVLRAGIDILCPRRHANTNRSRVRLCE